MCLSEFMGLCGTIDCYWTGSVYLNGDFTHKGSVYLTPKVQLCLSLWKQLCNMLWSSFVTSEKITLAMPSGVILGLETRAMWQKACGALPVTDSLKKCYWLCRHGDHQGKKLSTSAPAPSILSPISHISVWFISMIKYILRETLSLSEECLKLCIFQWTLELMKALAHDMVGQTVNVNHASSFFLKNEPKHWQRGRSRWTIIRINMKPNKNKIDTIVTLVQYMSHSHYMVMTWLSYLDSTGFKKKTMKLSII